jgi:hypothetical protein
LTELLDKIEHKFGSMIYVDFSTYEYKGQDNLDALKNYMGNFLRNLKRSYQEMVEYDRELQKNIVKVSSFDQIQSSGSLVSDIKYSENGYDYDNVFDLISENSSNMSESINTMIKEIDSCKFDRSEIQKHNHRFSALEAESKPNQKNLPLNYFRRASDLITSIISRIRNLLSPTGTYSASSGEEYENSLPLSGMVGLFSSCSWSRTYTA